MGRPTPVKWSKFTLLYGKYFPKGRSPFQGVVSDVYEQESVASYTHTICSADVNLYCPLLTSWNGVLFTKLTVVDLVQKFRAAH